MNQAHTCRRHVLGLYSSIAKYQDYTHVKLQESLFYITFGKITNHKHKEGLRCAVFFVALAVVVRVGCGSGGGERGRHLGLVCVCGGERQARTKETLVRRHPWKPSALFVVLPGAVQTTLPSLRHQLLACVESSAGISSQFRSRVGQGPCSTIPP